MYADESQVALRRCSRFRRGRSPVWRVAIRGSSPCKALTCFVGHNTYAEARIVLGLFSRCGASNESDGFS